MTQAPSDIVVVGGGLAGAKVVAALRERGYDGRLTLVGAEAELPYERPPLSKDYLAGKADFDSAVVYPEQWYVDRDVQLRRGVAATAVRAGERVVELADGGDLRYDGLVLATGSRPRALPIPGVELALTLRDHPDSDAVRACFGDGRRLVIVGAGWIGLEVAAAAREAGTEVTVLEAAELPLLGVLGAELGEVYAQLHRDHGVDLRPRAEVAAIEAGGVRLAGGSLVAGDAVLLAVGAEPRLELAESAGLAVDGGVLVDAALRTSDPAIVAVGDIANHDHPVLGRRVRVEHWATALNQPAVAAATLLGGDEPYTELPYFFSDQYDAGMEYLGHVPPGADARVVVRGDLAGREFVAFWLTPDDRMLAAMNVNVWDVVDEVKPLIAGGTRVDPGRLSEPGTPIGAAARR